MNVDAAGADCVRVVPGLGFLTGFGADVMAAWDDVTDVPTSNTVLFAITEGLIVFRSGVNIVSNGAASLLSLGQIAQWTLAAIAMTETGGTMTLPAILAETSGVLAAADTLITLDAGIWAFMGFSPRPGAGAGGGAGVGGAPGGGRRRRMAGRAGRRMGASSAATPCSEPRRPIGRRCSASPPGAEPRPPPRRSRSCARSCRVLETVAGVNLPLDQLPDDAGGVALRTALAPVASALETARETAIGPLQELRGSTERRAP